MSATSKSSLPAPRNNWVEINAKRADRKAAFIRETAARFYAALIASGRSIAEGAELPISCAEDLAHALENKGYL